MGNGYTETLNLEGLTVTVSKKAGIWSLIFILILGVSLLAALFFAWQLRRSAPPPGANFLAAEKGYGVTIDLTGYDPDTLNRTVADMQANGLTWIRQPVDWATIEPEPGQFNWQSLDRVVEASSPSKLIFVLQNPPEWARPIGSLPTSPPDQLSNFGNFARALAERYGQQVDHYQIWHEPNLSANWGDTYVDPVAYADMLREAALNIRDADPAAHILTAALAATTEDNPLNLNEMTYLDRLYQAKANRWFDIVAIQPYGLWTKPLDVPAPDQPNFRRAELVRQVMLNHNDADTPVWATAFGWVALPANWSGRPSPWSYDLPSVQTNRTTQAIDYARANWPWMGPMLAARWNADDLASDDPTRGFALVETPPMLNVFNQAAQAENTTTVGNYPANHKTGHYSPGWRFAKTRADIPQDNPRALTLFFEGTQLDLHLNRGPYRGYLWVTIDDQPANALPQNGQGQSYVVLYDPLTEPATVTLAQNLPASRHTAVIEADGGWEQWAINGWSVYNRADTRLYRFGLFVALGLAAVSAAGLLWQFFRAPKHFTELLLRWCQKLIASYALLGERGQIAVTFALAVTLYFLPSTLALLILPLPALAILLRPDLGLMLIAFAIFFFQTPVQLPVGSFSPVELTLALTIAGVIFRSLVSSGKKKFWSEKEATGKNFIFQPSSFRLHSTDWAAIILVLLALLATLVAQNFTVSLREWRTVIVESIIFYFLVRLGLDYNPRIPHSTSRIPPWVWRLIDAFVAGAALQATIALYLYFFTDRSIDAEGVHRALGLGYGSPNNLALVLDRAWPILLAVAVLPGQSVLRRSLYGAGVLVTSLALYLTFSKGALLLGLPAGLAVMTLLYGLHRWPQYRGRVIGAAVGVLALFGLALIPFSQTERVRATFIFEEGSTALFRVKLWQASWQMLQDNWPLGVGLDNFLYQYRTRYILPEAWQEPNLNHPHNLVLDFGTRLGIAGIALLLWLQIAFWGNAWRLYKHRFDPLILGMIGSMVIFLAHGLVDNSYFLVDLAFAFFLIVGIVQRLVEQTE